MRILKMFPTMGPGGLGRETHEFADVDEELPPNGPLLVVVDVPPLYPDPDPLELCESDPMR
jgi:hypothetical protein